MARGGQPKGQRRGGRKPGTPNKRTEATIAKAEASGLLPLDYMLSVLRDPERPDPERFAAAKEAAPYLHAKLASVEAKVDASGQLTIVVKKLAGD